MGKSGQQPLRLVTERTAVPATGRTVFCPCLAGIPGEIACTVGILPVHDANGRLLEELAHADFSHVPDYAGICMVDPFRRLDDILDQVDAAGIKGVINLPTVVPFLGQEQNDAISALHARERTALERARERGFEFLFVTTEVEADNDFKISLDRLVFAE